ncbi:MAG TPA: hypothetical protein VK880_04875 [Anaerolineales bacterium]|nr:hypothetical protein [Anaerolineales bacterium]
MTTPASDQNEPSKMKKLISGSAEDPIRARLPRGSGSTVLKPPASGSTSPVPASASSEAAPKASRSSRIKSSAAPAKMPRFKFLPAFWTIASIMSVTVNIVLLIALLLALQTLNSFPTIPAIANDQVAGLLGGLYTNFVKMDQATIASTIPVDAVIPLNIVVPVQATTRITLAESVVIPNAHVRINTGALNINADAVVTLPANTPLMVNLDFPLNVQNSIPIHLDVPVNIPLNQTELHEPFVGLQKVVEPWYCLVEPDASINGLLVCSPTSNPAPAETVIP